MEEDHPRPRKFHDRSDFIPHFRLIAVDPAFRAHRFVLAEGASEISLCGIFKQFLTVPAALIRPMEMPAVHVNHDANCFQLPLHSLYRSGKL